jgi:putative SOS response-associated peptidase YedK
VFGFLTTEPNALIKQYHSKAVPVILTTQDEIDTWMDAPTPVALQLQRPLPDDALVVVARGAKQDGGESELRTGTLL